MSTTVGPKSPQAPATPDLDASKSAGGTTPTKPTASPKPAPRATKPTDQFAKGSVNPVAMQREASGPHQALTQPDRRGASRTTDSGIYKAQTRQALAAILNHVDSHQYLATRFDAAFA